MHTSVVVNVPNILSFLFHARDDAHAPVYNMTARSENHREQGSDLVKHERFGLRKPTFVQTIYTSRRDANVEKPL